MKNTLRSFVIVSALMSLLRTQPQALDEMVQLEDADRISQQSVAKGIGPEAAAANSQEVQDALLGATRGEGSGPLKRGELDLTPRQKEWLRNRQEGQRAGLRSESPGRKIPKPEPPTRIPQSSKGWSSQAKTALLAGMFAVMSAVTGFVDRLVVAPEIFKVVTSNLIVTEVTRPMGLLSILAVVFGVGSIALAVLAASKYHSAKAEKTGSKH